MTETGYTGSKGYETPGIVHREEFLGRCECGGWVNAFENGEIISHSAPLDLKVRHASMGQSIMFGREWFTGG